MKTYTALGKARLAVPFEVPLDMLARGVGKRLKAFDRKAQEAIVNRDV